MTLSDHRVLVTGGTAGIGLALARAFLARGNRVVVCSRSAERIAAARQTAPDLVTLQADVGRSADLERLVRDVTHRLGGLSILVNNAAVQFPLRLPETPAAEVVRLADQEVGANLTGLIQLTALALPALRAAPEAAIVNVSSVLALAPKASAPVYCATKAAVRSFTQALRFQLENADSQIRVFELMPPLVDTDMTRGRWRGELTPEQVAAFTLDGMAAGRLELRPGLARPFYWLHRLVPGALARRMRRA
ncbi:MAG: SDR family NAD(P)-dependent oxidoreductase [Gemmatimonadota bacterium]|nr:SDR family NAD(P)-dependent oxidoreductase [Gemmatimonadota bacterium]